MEKTWAGVQSQGAAGETIKTGHTTPTIRVSRIILIIGAVFALLLLLSLCGTAMTYSSENPALHKIAKVFLFEEERNLPTLFNFALLLASMAVLAIVAAFRFGSRDRWRGHWLFLAGIFLLLAYDEAAQVHEKVGEIVKGVVDTGGFLAFAWVIPGAAVVLAVGLAFSRFLLALPKRDAGLFVLAGALYVGGAIGVEMLEAKVWSNHGFDNITYSLLATLEESLEMIGLMVLVRAALGVLAGPGGILRFRLYQAGHDEW